MAERHCTDLAAPVGSFLSWPGKFKHQLFLDSVNVQVCNWKIMPLGQLVIYNANFFKLYTCEITKRVKGYLNVAKVELSVLK